MSVNIISCSKSEFSAVFETQLGLPRRANPRIVRSMRTVLRTRTHVPRTLCAAAAACSRLVDDVERRPERVRPAPARSTMLVRYAGHVPCETECTMQHSLNSTRRRTGSQCNCSRHGLACSRLLSLKIKRAAEFWTRCSGATVAWGRSASAALQ